MTESLTDDRHAAIRAREAAATPGPWVLDDDFAEIKAPASHDTIADYWEPTHASRNGQFIAHARTDVPALLDEVARLRARVAERTQHMVDIDYERERLRARVAELETYAHGCDAEGCVLPHSSWCERAKQAAAEHDGCTCPQPWKGSPQPHAGYCWLVSPPRDEVERLRARVAELETAARATAFSEAAAIAKQMIGISRWHRDTLVEVETRLNTAAWNATHAIRTAPPTPAADASADEWVRCSGLHCKRSERFTRATERGWEHGHMDTWQCPQCAANAADRRDLLGR